MAWMDLEGRILSESEVSDQKGQIPYDLITCGI